ncbi:MAG: VTT domain-containing protein [Rhodoluna sp.]|nr:VTT domain-containing protein [Rhodoluna sp.]
MNINDILHPDALLESLGSWALVIAALIVVAETGLLLGFFLPGDSLLFTVGLLIGSGTIESPIWLACLVISVSAVIGDQLGYFIGLKAGPAVFKRPDSKLFSHKNVERTQAFFAKYGSKAVIFAHFVPIMRTFVPVAAGVGKMPYRYYLRNNIIGALTWGLSVPLLGYFLGGNEFIKANVILITLVLVALSFIPVIIEIVKSRVRGSSNNQVEN